MRAGLVVVGIVLLILGAVLLLVPLVPQASQTVTEQAPYIANVGGYSLFGSNPISLAWTSSASITFIVGTCSQAVTNNQCTGSNTTTTQTGTSGTVNINVPNGGSFAIVVFGNSTASASVSIKLAETTVGTILLIVGILLLILGLVLRRKKPAPSTPAATPANPPT